MIKTAYFRTYLPAIRVGALPPARGHNSEQTVMQDGTFMWTESTTDDALFTVWQGEQFACPRNTRIRMIEGVLAFTRTYPAMPVVGEIERLKLVAELSKLRNASSLSRSYILSSPWHVPLRWFSAFAPSERELYETPEGPSIRYRTSIGEAIDRVHWSATVLANAGFPEQVIERVVDLERWLIEYSADSSLSNGVTEKHPNATTSKWPPAGSLLRHSPSPTERSPLADRSPEVHFQMPASTWQVWCLTIPLLRRVPVRSA